MRIFDQARSYLSFRDLCASRPVSKSWMDIRSVPHTHPVYFFEDGSHVDLPDSDDPNFRKCLLAATLHKFHCQIFNQDELQFVLQIFPSVRDLTIEFDGREGDHLRPGEALPTWDGNVLSTASSARKIDISVTKLDGGPIIVNFGTLRSLTHLEVDYPIRVENFDNRDLDSFGYIADYWDEAATRIGINADVVRITRKEGLSNAYSSFFNRWTRENIKPRKFEFHVFQMTFFDLTRETLTVYPIFGLPGVQYAQFVEEYRAALETIFNRLPGCSVRFEEGCPDEMKQSWIQIINPIRESYGLPAINN